MLYKYLLLIEGVLVSIFLLGLLVLVMITQGLESKSRVEGLSHYPPLIVYGVFLAYVWYFLTHFDDFKSLSKLKMFLYGFLLPSAYLVASIPLLGLVGTAFGS